MIRRCCGAARPKPERIRSSSIALRAAVNAKLDERWAPQQISRHLARAHPADPAMRACLETIYRALFAWWPPGRVPLTLETSVPGVFAIGDVRHRRSSGLRLPLATARRRCA